MNRDEFKGHLEKSANSEILAVDTEGYFEIDNNLLDVTECVGLSIGGPTHEAYFPFKHIVGTNLPGEWLQEVKNVIEQHPRLVFHNAKHDIVALDKLGIKSGPFYDTMLMAHMVDENIPNKGLDYLSTMYGGMPKQRPEAMIGIIKLLGWAYVHTDLMAPYGANDARITHDLFYELYPDFKVQGFDSGLWDYEQDFSRLLGQMELQGIAINQELVASEIAFGEARMAEIVKELRCNPGSPKELGKLLIDDLGLPPVINPKSKTQKPAFDKHAMGIYDELLSRRQDTRAQLVREYRGWSTALGLNYRTYQDRLSGDGRIRCNYKLHGTVTGRLSCEKPNLQQIPRDSPKRWNGKLKQAFRGSEGFRLWEADYKQLEFRLGAAYGKEHKLIEIFNDPERDIFNEIASEVQLDRQDTKTLNYTIQFGGGATRISEVFGVSLSAAKAIKDNYYRRFPGIRKATDLASLRCKQQGYITMWTGRRRHFDDSERQAHKAFNAAIQGGAAEVVKRAMLRLQPILSEECRMLLQVHDSVVFEIAEGKETTYLPEIRNIMEAREPDFGVHLAVEIHEWGK